MHGLSLSAEELKHAVRQRNIVLNFLKLNCKAFKHEKHKYPRQQHKDPRRKKKQS